MGPSTAELARTLASGTLSGQLYVAWAAGPYPVEHVTDPLGRPLLLIRDDSPLGAALAAGADDRCADESGPAVVLTAGARAASSGPAEPRLWLSGRARPLAGAVARQAALQYADVRPAGALLDVGATRTLHLVEVDEVRLAVEGSAPVPVDLADYADAEPDPLHPHEGALLGHLADQHPDVVRALAAGVVPETAESVWPMALDRYGLVLAYRVDGIVAEVRLAFPRPLSGGADLSHALHTLGACPCVLRDRAVSESADRT